MVKWKKYLAAAMILFLLAGHTTPFSRQAEAADNILTGELTGEESTPAGEEYDIQDYDTQDNAIQDSAGDQDLDLQDSAMDQDLDSQDSAGNHDWPATWDRAVLRTARRFERHTWDRNCHPLVACFRNWDST